MTGEDVSPGWCYHGGVKKVEIPSELNRNEQLKIIKNNIKRTISTFYLILSFVPKSCFVDTLGGLMKS